MKVLPITRSRRLTTVLLLTTIVLLGALMMMTDAWYDTPSGYSINSPTSTTYESLGGGPSSQESSSSSDDGQTRYSILQQLMALKKKLTSMDSSSKGEEEFVFPGQQRSDESYSQKQQYTPYDYGSTGFFPLNVAGVASITESRDQTNEFLSNMQASYRPYRTGQHEIKSTSAASDMGGGSYGYQGFYPIPADQQQQQQDQSFRFPGQQQQQQQQPQQQQEGFRYPGQQQDAQLGTAGLSVNQGGNNGDDTSVFFDAMKRGYEPYRSREGQQVTLSSSDWNQLSSTGFFFPSYANAQLQSYISSSQGEGDQTSTFSNIMKQNYMPYSLGMNEIPSPATVGTEFNFPGQQQQQGFRFPGQQHDQQQQQEGFRYPGGLSQTGLLSSQQSSEGDQTNQFLNSMRSNYSPYSTGANVQPSGEQQWNYGSQGFFSTNSQQQSTFKFPGQ